MCQCPDLGKTVVWGEEAKTQMMGQKPNLGMKDPTFPLLLYNFVNIHLSFRFLVSSFEKRKNISLKVFLYESEKTL